MSGNLDVPKSRADSMSGTGTMGSGLHLKEDENTSLSANKSNADVLLMKLAGKPGKKLPDKVIEGKKQKSRTTGNKKLAKSKAQPPKALRGFITKEHKIGKQNDLKEHRDSRSKSLISENGQEMPLDWNNDIDDEELASFRELFSMLDQSNTGVITAANLYEEMRRIDNEITYEEVEDVLKKVDKDGSGTIDFDELYHYFAQIGDDSGGVDEEKKKRVERRKRLFYSAITQFSLRQTVEELEKSLRIQQTPHVISHYSAGARLIGKTTRQMTKEMKKMQKRAAKNDSPYAKPPMFVHMGTKKIVRSKFKSQPSAQGQQTTTKDDSKGGAQKTSDHDDVRSLSKLGTHLKLLVHRGSLTEQLPEAHQIIVEWKRKVSAQLWKGTEKRRGSVSPGLPPIPEAKVQPEEKKKAVTTSPFQQHSFVTVRSPEMKSKPKRLTYSLKKRRIHKGWCTPRIIYLGVSLPSLKMNLKSHKATVNDLPSIRAKAKDAIDVYYRNLRQTVIRNAWEHWDRLYADVIRPKKLLENFKKVYGAYSPNREEDSFVVCPWGPGAFRYLKLRQMQPGPFRPHRSTAMQDTVNTHAVQSTQGTGLNDFIVRPLSSLF